MGILTAVVGLLLGNFLIGTLFAPALSRLRDILQKFASIQLPFESIWALLGRGEMSPKERQEAQDKATAAFNLYFREYSIAFEAFKRLGYIFLGSVVSLVFLLAWQLSLPLKFRLSVGLVSGGIIAALGFYAQRIVAPSPERLISIDYLANLFPNLHLEPLFDSSETRIHFGQALGSPDPDMHFKLFTKAMILGYKLLIAITDARCSTLYFIAYGDVDHKTRFTHIWDPDFSGFQLSLGDLNRADHLMATNQLYLHLWLFVPIPRRWLRTGPDHPRFISHEMNDPGIGSRLHSDTCQWQLLDRNIDFVRRFILGFPSWTITDIRLPTEDCPQRIVKMFKRKLKSTTRLITEAYPGGSPIRVERSEN